MDFPFIIILAAFISALAVSLAGTRIVIYLAPKMGWIEEIKKDRWHSIPTAKLGGIAIYIALVAVTIVFFWPLTDMKVVGLLVGTTMIFILGLLDDLRPIAPGIKVLAEAAAAAVVVVFGIYSEYFNPFIGIPLTIFWIVAVTNAYNLIDNMDGLSSGIAAISSLTLLALSTIMGWTDTALLSAVMCGAALGFLRYNFNPARVFMGDCGALTIGFYLSVVTLIGSMTYMSNLIITLVAPILVMAVPLLDTTFVALLRAASGRPVHQGGRDHTSHRLVIMGLSEKKSVILIYLFSLVFGGFAVFLAFPGASYPLISMLLLICLVFLFFLGLFLSEADLTEVENGSRADNGPGRITALFLKKRHTVFEIIADALIIAASYILAYYLMGHGSIGRAEGPLLGRSLPIFVFFQMISFFLFGAYRGVWKYVSFGDLMRIVQAALAGTVVSSVILFLFTFFEGYSVFVMIVYFFIMTFFITARVASFRAFAEFFTRHRARQAEKKAIIFGAGDSGNIVLREILNNGVLARRPLGFVDDDPAKIGRVINGLKVLGTRHDLGRVIREKGADEVIVAVSNLSEERRRYIEHICSELGITVTSVPGILDVDR
jgi:UDP-GlcNAc:undecaprenyl-phosphate GlcNAc-1-phosphate transferase